MTKQIIRCDWAGDQPIYIDYHDKEWGTPVYDSLHLFAMLILEGAQAGLSWITILKRRQGYYQCFDELNPQKMAQYDQAKVAMLLQDSRIIRNKLKVNAAIGNAKAFIEMKQQSIDFSQFLWQFVDEKPIQNSWKTMQDIPVNTTQSDAMSKALKKAGFKFVGSTICYAFMQAVGMVNDHLVDCFCYQKCKKKSP